ncbi:LacI family DNA-binding transcriptional regulator [Microvirga antarctica]|uniref:LacI family DNA-binding transcriptional regulator n=1 Tax=Microvirga antarctica TaxID=2819233 RepID=UPI001B3129A6|nr:LacI family DNA-binding transcriptional regulator [Microvirga antarctica]
MNKKRQVTTAPVSLAQVAAAAGVSVATVSRIVNGQTQRASTETAARIREVIETLGYRPNHVGRALRRRESRIVAMLSPNLDNPAMAAIAASTEAALRAAGYVMILCDTHDRPDLQDEYLHAMRSQGVRGYVLVNAVDSLALAGAVGRGDPIVFVGRRNPVGPGPFVGIDNYRAGADAADHFWSLGIRRPAVIYPSQGSSTTRDRVAGFIERMRHLGIAEDQIRRADAPGLSHLQVGYEAARILVGTGDWPSGLLCASDLMAYGAYRLAWEQSVSIPADCRILGVDDNALNAWLAPWLTSVHIPYDAFGSRVVAQLEILWRGDQPEDDLLPHRLVAR